MLTRWIAIVATLLLACANPQASAHVRAERVSTSLADWAAAERSAHANKTALPAKSATNPQTARPARSGPDNPTPGKNAALSDCRVWGNWSPLQKCASMPAVYQWEGTKLAGRTNAVGNSLGDYQHAYAWPISSREGTERSTLHADTHGTPQLITTATGAIAGWTRTDVWGVEKAQSGAQSRIGHTGYLKDPLLDELYAQARQYRPGVGRFTTVDEWAGDFNNPISLNKYLAFNGNPGSLVDPDGRCAGPILIWCVAEAAAWFGVGGSVAYVAAEAMDDGALNNGDLGYKGIPLKGGNSTESMVAEPREAWGTTLPAQLAASGWFTGGETPALPGGLETGVMPGATIEPQLPSSTASPIPEDIGGRITSFPSGDGVDSSPMLSEAPNAPESTVLRTHRAGNRQVETSSGHWNVPKHVAIGSLPRADPVGDQLQEMARKASSSWSQSQLSAAEQGAIEQAREAGEHWRAVLIERQARGRWVESEVRAGAVERSLDLKWNRIGVDARDPATGISYDILSGTPSNIDAHAKRMAAEKFRMIKF